MQLNGLIKNALLTSGWYVKRLRNLPSGIIWSWDLKRLLKSAQSGTLFDIGANVGQTTLCMRREFPQATIHAFEPVPDAFSLLQRNTSSLDRVFVHNLAMSNSEGHLEFSYLPNAEMRNSLASRFDADPSARRANARLTTTDNFCREQGIDHIALLKTDTEGHDALVLKGGADMFARERIDAVLTEVTFDHTDSFHTQFRAVDDYLASVDFLLCALYETEELQRTSKDGSYCNALFLRRNILARA